MRGADKETQRRRPKQEDSESRCKYCCWCEVLVGNMCDAELIVGQEKRRERERQPNDGCRESGVREGEQKDRRMRREKALAGREIRTNSWHNFSTRFSAE